MTTLSELDTVSLTTLATKPINACRRSLWKGESGAGRAVDSQLYVANQGNEPTNDAAAVAQAVWGMSAAVFSFDAEV